jgi:hypothetical protein
VGVAAPWRRRCNDGWTGLCCGCCVQMQAYLTLSRYPDKENVEKYVRKVCFVWCCSVCFFVKACCAAVFPNSCARNCC